jgi:hypothetical protein
MRHKALDLLTLRTLIGRKLVAPIYWIGVLIITAAAVLYMLPTRIPFLGEVRTSLSQILIGSFLLIFGNGVWRIFCETAAAVFRLLDEAGRGEAPKDDRSGNSTAPGRGTAASA